MHRTLLVGSAAMAFHSTLTEWLFFGPASNSLIHKVNSRVHLVPNTVGYLSVGWPRVDVLPEREHSQAWHGAQVIRWLIGVRP